MKAENNGNFSHLNLTDILAINRTILANERTFLAYIRTALNTFAAGITFIQFFELSIVRIFGYILLPVGLVVAIIGFLRFLRVKKNIDKLS